MRQICKVLLMVFGLGHLLSCGQSNPLSGWLDNDKKLSQDDASIMSQWLMDNGLNAEAFSVSEPPKGHSGEFSVIVADRHIQSIRAKGVNSLKGLSQLPALATLELNNVKKADLSDCPAQLKSLSVSGEVLAALDGVQSCQQLEKIKVVHSAVTSMAPLLTLPQLTSIKINFSQLTSVEIAHKAPVLNFLDLSDNQISHFVIRADLPQLEILVLDNNQLTNWAHNNHTPTLGAISLSNNQIEDLETVAPINSVKRITLKNNPLQNLTALTEWPNLKTIDFDGTLSDPSAPINRKISQLSGPLELQIAEAEYLKASYLNNIEFIETLPKSTGGKAYGVGKNISSHFNLHKNPKVSGAIRIDTLNGLMRLQVTKTDDILQYHRKIVMQGQATVEQGQLIIYSPIEKDFWDMAKLFVDTPIKQRPQDRDDLLLKGFIVHRVTPGEPHEFRTNLVAMAGIYFLLLGPEQGEVSGIKLEFD
ncbi:MAG: leucine-rich repeat domain-containing protein [Proteobacteria bacterium]|nr:MAG: leucine-rich repeat domain-containing protein [Pseudomonadota bacterium]